MDTGDGAEIQVHSEAQSPKNGSVAVAKRLFNAESGRVIKAVAGSGGMIRKISHPGTR